MSLVRSKDCANPTSLPCRGCVIAWPWMREKRDLETRSRPEMQLIKKYFRMVLGLSGGAKCRAYPRISRTRNPWPNYGWWDVLLPFENAVLKLQKWSGMSQLSPLNAIFFDAMILSDMIYFPLAAGGLHDATEL